MLIMTYYEKIIFLTVTINALACFLFLYFNIKLQDNDKRYLNSFFTKLKRHISNRKRPVLARLPPLLGSSLEPAKKGKFELKSL